MLGTEDMYRVSVSHCWQEQGKLGVPSGTLAEKDFGPNGEPSYGVHAGRNRNIRCSAL